MDQAVTSRYETFTVYLLVSICFLVPAVVDDRLGQRRPAVLISSWARWMPFAAALLIFLHVLNSVAAVRQMVSMRTKRLQAKACLLFVNVVPGECLNEGFPDLEQVRTRINAVNDLGYLRPTLIKSRVAGALAVPLGDPSRYGRFEKLGETDDVSLVAGGWAGLPNRGEPADAVLLTYETDRTAPIIFGLADMDIEEPSWWWLFATTDPLRWRWHESIALAKTTLPSRARINAWAFDSTIGKAFKLDGTFLVETGGAGSRVEGIEDAH
jgi:hypothetical protein